MPICIPVYGQAKKSGDAYPDNAPDEGFFKLDMLRPTVENTGVKAQDKDNKQGKGKPEDGFSCHRDIGANNSTILKIGKVVSK